MRLPFLTAQFNSVVICRVGFPLVDDCCTVSENIIPHTPSPWKHAASQSANIPSPWKHITFPINPYHPSPWKHVTSLLEMQFYWYCYYTTLKLENDKSIVSMGQSVLLNNHRLLEEAAKFYIPTSSLYTVNQVLESLNKIVWFYVSLLCFSSLWRLDFQNVVRSALGVYHWETGKALWVILGIVDQPMSGQPLLLFMSDRQRILWHSGLREA